MPAKNTIPETAVNGQGDAPAAAGGAVAAVTREISNVLADAEDLLKATTSITGEDMARVRAQLAKGIASARQSLQQMGTSVAEGARRTAKTTDAYVHEQPWKAIGASAAVAFLLGMLIARRN